MSIHLKQTQWEDFSSKYSSTMYKDKLACRVKKSQENPDYVEIIFGLGINHNGYDLVEEYLLQNNQSNKGEQNV